MEINHAEYQEKVKTMTDGQLKFVISDCQQAIAAMPNGHKAGYYADEINYCRMELNRRAKQIKPELIVWRCPEGYLADYSKTPERDKILTMFNAVIIPTAFTEKANPEYVKSEISRLNPEYNVVMRLPERK